MTDPIRVLICGTGSGAHALAAVASKNPRFEVRVLTQSADRAQRWTEIMQRERLTVMVRNGNDSRVTWKANCFVVTDQPEQAARGCDLIILAVPAYRHWQYLVSLEPYLEDGGVIVGLPGQNGFDFDVSTPLGPNLQIFLLIN